MSIKNSKLLQKANDGIFKAKSYWNKPPKGYQVSYKEFASYAVGTGGQSFLAVLTQYTGLATSVHLMISYFKLTTGMAWFLGIIGAAIVLIRSPILSVIIDNSNGKKGKFKPFLMWTMIASVICFGLIPYIPVAWTEINLFSFSMPAIPIMGVTEASSIHFNLAIVLAFVLVQVGSFFSTLLGQCVGGIEKTMTSVAQERANIGALRGLIGNLPQSIINVFIPILTGTVFASKGGWNAVEMYRWVFPICGVGAIILMAFMVRNVKERAVVKQTYVAKVKFGEAIKLLSKNKYFWIINIYNVINGVRGLANITAWITQYSFSSATAKTIVGLYCSTLLQFVVTAGFILGPILIKKMGKRKLMIFSNIGFSIMIGIQLIFYKNPIIILITSFFQGLFGGFYYVPGLMASDTLDYIQYKSGKRIEGFWENYSAIIGTVLGIFTGILAPLFLSFGNIGFGDNLSEVFQDTTLRNSAFFYQTLLALIASVVLLIPSLFYDLTEKKHGDIVRVLKIRAATDNFSDGKLQDEDILNLYEIIDYAQKNNNTFVQEELDKHLCLDEILSGYDEAKTRADAIEKEENMKELERNIELETKKMESRLQKQLEKAQKEAVKKYVPFDAEKFAKEFRESFIASSRFLKDKHLLEEAAQTEEQPETDDQTQEDRAE